ncbi:MAG: hypothetical protein RL224_1097, partial [Actinomycetota bacterium]
MKFAAFGLALLLALSGCTATEKVAVGECDGVAVEVNFGTLGA